MTEKTLNSTVVIWHEPGELDRKSTATLLIEYWPNYFRDHSAIAAAIIDKDSLLVEGSWVHFDHLIRFSILDLGEKQSNG